MGKDFPICWPSEQVAHPLHATDRTIARQIGLFYCDPRRQNTMKIATCVLVFLACASVGAAKERADYQNGKIMQMDSAACGVQEKGNKTVAGEIFGTDGQHKKTQEILCQEYTL